MVGCLPSNKRRVTPLPGLYDDFDFIEVRPHRFLRICHSNLPRCGRKSSSSNHLRNQFFPAPSSNLLQFGLTNEEGSSCFSVSPTPTPNCSGERNCELRSTLCEERRAAYRSPSSVCKGLSSVESSDWVIFFFHGVGGCADIWKHQIEHFSQRGHRVIAPDMLGHGMSAAPRRANLYSFKQSALDALAIFDLYSDAKGNVLVGHSLGSSLATYVADKRRYAVSKLVLVSGGSPTPLLPETCGIFHLPTGCVACIRPCFQCYFTRQLYSKQKSVRDASSHDIPVSSFVIKHTILGQFWEESDEEFHKKLKVDTQLIHGLDDQLVSMREELDMLKCLRYCRLDILNSASHMCMRDQPLVFAQILSTFIAQPVPPLSDFVDYHLAGFLRSKRTTAHIQSSTLSLDMPEPNLSDSGPASASLPSNKEIANAHHPALSSVKKKQTAHNNLSGHDDRIHFHQAAS